MHSSFTAQGGLSLTLIGNLVWLVGDRNYPIDRLRHPTCWGIVIKLLMSDHHCFQPTGAPSGQVPPVWNTIRGNGLGYPLLEAHYPPLYSPL